MLQYLFLQHYVPNFSWLGFRLFYFNLLIYLFILIHEYTQHTRTRGRTCTTRLNPSVTAWSKDSMCALVMSWIAACCFSFGTPKPGSDKCFKLGPLDKSSHLLEKSMLLRVLVYYMCLASREVQPPRPTRKRKHGEWRYFRSPFRYCCIIIIIIGLLFVFFFINSSIVCTKEKTRTLLFTVFFCLLHLILYSEYNGVHDISCLDIWLSLINKYFPTRMYSIKVILSHIL